MSPLESTFEQTTYLFERLQEVGAGDGDHNVNLVYHKERFVDHGVGNVGKVVCQVEHHWERVSRGVVELL